MVPVPLFHNKYRASSAVSAAPRLLYIAISFVSKYALQFLHAEENAYGYHGTNAYNERVDEGFGGSGGSFNADGGGGRLVRRASDLDDAPPWKRVLFPLLIPVLVLSSGVFAGLTLGYMSLDETQLNVLSISGTPKQREYANKIKPIRKNGHLLLVTLLLANMIVNETLPVIADPVLGGGFQGVVVSTVLIVIFAEVIPQSLFTRHGLYLGAKMAWFTTILIYGLGIISWPVAKLLEFVLGKHHGIIYRRAELKELIAMHDSHEAHGGDLKTDTVTIIGATLDLQEKVVKQAMTPIDDVFMLSIDSKLDYDLMKKICQTGHSRVPVYEEVEVPIAAVPLGSGIPSSSVVENKAAEGSDGTKRKDERMVRVKKIVGVLLVKHCVLLDPRDATPLRKIPLNKVPFVPNNEPLLGMLDKFQEGRSHMAIVSRYSVEKAQSVKKAVKRGLTQRLRARVGMGDTDSSSSSSDDETDSGTSGLSYAKRWAGRKKQGRTRKRIRSRKSHDGEGNGNGSANGNTEVEDGATIDADGETLKEDRTPETAFSPPPYLGTDVDGAAEGIEMQEHRQHWSSDSLAQRNKRQNSNGDDKTVTVTGSSSGNEIGKKKEKEAGEKKTTFQLSTLSKQAGAVMTGSLLEQSMPADAVLAKEGADEFLQSFDPAVMPLGIITLEDVLEELIGEEIYDEFDPQGAHGDPYAYDVAPPPGVVQGPAGTHSLDVKYSSETSNNNINPTTLLDTHTATAPSAPAPRASTGTSPGYGSGTGIGSGSSAGTGTGGGVSTPSTGRSIPILIPGIPMFKFLTRRSKSAPPVPRDKQKPGQAEREGVVDNGADTMKDDEIKDEKDEKSIDGNAGDEKPSDVTGERTNSPPTFDTTTQDLTLTPPALQMPTPVRGGGRTNPPPATGTTIQDPAPTSPALQMPMPVRGIPRATIQQLGMTSLSPSSPSTSNSGTRSLSNSRSASPAPSLEVILLERNRRRLARESGGFGNGAGVAAGSMSTGGYGHGEGGRARAFKSSPLSPVAVVAERIREGLERERKAKEEEGAGDGLH